MSADTAATVVVVACGLVAAAAGLWLSRPREAAHSRSAARRAARTARPADRAQAIGPAVVATLGLVGAVVCRDVSLGLLGAFAGALWLVDRATS